LNIYYWLIKVLMTLKTNDLSEIIDWVVILNELKFIFISFKAIIRSVELYNIPCECDLKVDI